MSAKSALLLCPLLLACVLPQLVAGYSESASESLCSSSKSVSMKRLAGSNRVGLFKLRPVESRCQKVLLTADTANAYVTEQCQRCQFGNDKVWRCDPVPERWVVRGNCRLVLGPDCNRYSADKNDETAGCA